MLTLIKNGSIYSPEEKGICDILIAGEKIIDIADQIDLPTEINHKLIDATGKLITPGIVDLHVHIIGGGGEGGFATRIPDICLSTITKAGVTTVVGCLGTDDITRHPEALLAKANQLTEEGISAYIYTGSYQFPPPTITGSVKKDIAFITQVIGVGEVAISDHRSSQPTFSEFCRLVAQARLGGIIGGKAGLVHVHLGNGPRGLDLLFRLVEETEIPISQILPTHLSRTGPLLEQAIRFGQMGGNIDFTAKGIKNSAASKAVSKALKSGVSIDQITLSSDSNGSKSVLDENGDLVRLTACDISNLHAEVKVLIDNGLPIPDALKLVTSNPAKRVGLQAKGSLEPGKDADLLITSPDFDVESVMARGQIMIHEGQVLVKGTFET